MASGVYILDYKGRVLVSFDYRGDLDVSIPDKFMGYILSNERSQADPLFRVEDWYFMYIDRNGMYFMCATRINANVSLLLSFLSALARLLEDYLEVLTPDTIVDNFPLIYELLDEVMDYGYPQILDSLTLAEYILRDPRDNKAATSVPVNATGVVSWRKEGVHYGVNEVFIDVVEEVNLLVAKTGGVISNEIVGRIGVSAFLSGMPEVRIGLNDRVLFEQGGLNTHARGGDVVRRAIELEDVKFHQCVRLSQFERDRSITFVPPDDDFNLMTYRLSSTLKPMIQVEAQMQEIQNSRVSLTVRVRARFRPQLSAQDVEIIIPILHNADAPRAMCTAGRVRYSPSDSALIWSIRQFPGQKQFSLRAGFGLPSIGEAAESRRPIQVHFEMPGFTVSGLRIQFVKVIERSSYDAQHWIRYNTVGGDMAFRWRD